MLKIGNKFLLIILIFVVFIISLSPLCASSLAENATDSVFDDVCDENSDCCKDDFLTFSNYSSDLIQDDGGDTGSPTDIYVDASHYKYGDGSISNPYCRLEYVHVKDNVVIHLKNGDYTYTGSNLNNVTFMGESSQNTYINFDRTVVRNNNLVLINLTADKAFFNNAGDFTANNVLFQNSVRRDANVYGNSIGGCIFTEYDGSDENLHTLSLNNCSFKSNSAEYAGAIYVYKGFIDIINCVFSNNYAFNFGGVLCVENADKVTITNSSFLNDCSQEDAGGAIYISSSVLEMDNVNITNCSATFGSGITALDTVLKINGLFATGNVGTEDGGVIYQMYGNASITNSTFIGNSAKNGGAIVLDNLSSVLLSHNQFSLNVAENCAGAVYLIFNSNCTLIENVYENNSAAENNSIFQSDSLNPFIISTNYDSYTHEDGTVNIPNRYNLADYGLITSIKNQQDTGNCWAFSALACLESCILKAGNVAYDLSEENMKNIMAKFSDYGWDVTPNDGGIDPIAIGYLVGWLGPVNESADPFDAYSMLSPLFNPIVHVQNLAFLKRNDFLDNNNIKEAILKYGAVATGIHYDMDYMDRGSYYYSGDSFANHGVVIVGWDDMYSRYNFKNTPPGDGAWIIKNSWGTSWGNKGFAYVSYYDTKLAEIGVDDASYVFILDDTVHFDKNYQYDTSGKTDYLITGNDEIWYENIFTASDNEHLMAVSTYFNRVSNFDVSVYVNDVLRTNKSGMSNPGYYTINLDEPVFLNRGDVFKVVFKISTDDFANIPISESLFLNRELYSPGVSFFSFDGENWIDLYDYSTISYNHSYISQVACIKAFTAFTLNATVDLIYQAGFDFADIQAMVSDCYGHPLKSGIVVFNISGEEYCVNITDGYANLTHVFKNRNDTMVHALFNAEGFNQAFTDCEIDLANVNISINVIDCDAIVGVTLLDNAGGNVIVRLDDEEIYNQMAFESFNLTLNNLECKEHLIEVEYSGDENNNPLNLTKTITIYKMNSVIKINIGETEFGEDTIIFIELLGNATGSIAVIVEDISDIVQLVDGTATVIIGNLSAGIHNVAVLYFGDDTHNESYNVSSFKVDKAATEITVSAADITYGDSLLVNVASSVDGNYSVSVNDESKFVSVKDGVGFVEFTGLAAGTYVVVASFDGDDNHNNASANYSFTVNKADVTIDVVVDSIVYGDVLVVNVTGSFDGNYSVSVNDESKFVSVKDGVGSVEFTGLAAGNYVVVVSFDGDDNYNNASANYSFTVNKADVTIDVVVDSIVYGDVLVVNVTGTVDGNYTVSVNDDSKDVIVNEGIASVEFTGLAVGTYDVVVSFDGDENHNSASAEASVKVDKASTEITVFADDIIYGDVLVVNVELPSDATRRPTVTIGNESKLATIRNGMGSVKFTGLAVGTHAIDVSYTGDANYGKSSVNATVKVNRATPIISVSAKSVTYGEVLVVNVQLPGDVTRRATVTIGNESKLVSLIEGIGSVKFTGLSVGTHAIDVSYAGDVNYGKASVNATVKINRGPADIQVTAKPVNHGEDVIIDVQLPGDVTRRATVTIGNETKMVSLVDGAGSIKFRGLAVGTHDVRVEYAGDANYVKSSVNATVKVNKATPDIQITADDINYGETLVVGVQLPADVAKRATVTIGNVTKYASLKDGIGTVKFTGLSEGAHEVQVSYAGDTNYKKASNKTTITVKN